MPDIRWQQRFRNYQKALARLEANLLFVREALPAVDFTDPKQLATWIDEVPDLYKQGVIQSFEFTHELAWNVMKDFAEDQGYTNIRGSKDATRQAFQMGLLETPELWMQMIPNRNKSTHTYAEELANALFVEVVFHYRSAFEKFGLKMATIAHEDG